MISDSLGGVVQRKEVMEKLVPIIFLSNPIVLGSKFGFVPLVSISLSGGLLLILYRLIT